jgi:hypothetical protein
MNWWQDFLTKKQQYDKLVARRSSLRDSLQRSEDNLIRSKARLESADKGLAVIQLVAQATQQNLEYHISSLVTTALASVFPNPPEFLAEIEIQRNKTSCQLSFLEFGEKSKPTECAGGGPLDVASFSLRASYWSLKRTRATFVLDEPFKFVSPGLQHKVSDMLKMLSEKLHIQIIMVSHADEINYSADKTFHVEKDGEIAKVRVE